MPRVRVDPARCTGHGRCYVLAPDVFGEDERGYCVVTRQEIPASLAADARRGEANCPEHAITVEA
jgi:ferredoxin